MRTPAGSLGAQGHRFPKIPRTPTSHLPGWEPPAGKGEPVWTQFVDGFQYDVLGAVACDWRLRFSLSLNAAYEDWCELQTPYDVGGEWSCIPGTSHSTAGTTCTVDTEDEPVTTSAFKCEACSGDTPICSCTEAGCSANPEPTHRFDFTWQLHLGTYLESLTMPADDVCVGCTLRLERVF